MNLKEHSAFTVACIFAMYEIDGAYGMPYCSAICFNDLFSHLLSQYLSICTHALFIVQYGFRVQGVPTKPKLGRPTVFTPAEELSMHTFLLDCWFMFIPRTKEAFSLDIQFKVKYEKKVTPFTNAIPGILDIVVMRSVRFRIELFMK